MKLAATARIAIDWSPPWLAPYRSLGERVCRAFERGVSLAQALNSLADHGWPLLAAGALGFVSEDAAPPGEAYESFIARTAGVPTRDDSHDLFNALVWLVFPRIKRRLNELHAEEIGLAGVGRTRGAVRDALTLFDENAALCQVPPRLAQAWRARDWHSLFVVQRAAWSDARITLFGHALLDKLARPRKPITAHAWLVAEGADPQSSLLEQLTPESLAAKPFLPLPVLGVPGWWPANEDAAFYDDASVFRPTRG